LFYALGSINTNEPDSTLKPCPRSWLAPFYRRAAAERAPRERKKKIAPEKPKEKCRKNRSTASAPF
jgi:hypothetical protein